MNVKTVPFKAFSDQKAGTYVSSLPRAAPLHFFSSPIFNPHKNHVGDRDLETALLNESPRSGLRKKVSVFQKEHYSESFIASILLSIPEGAEGAGPGRCAPLRPTSGNPCKAS